MRAASMTKTLGVLAVMLLLPFAARAEAQGGGVEHAAQGSGSAMTPLAAGAGGAPYQDTSLLGVNVPRFVISSLGGAAGGALLGAAGYYVANAAMCPGGSDGFCSLGALVFGGTVGAALGIVGGTLLVGHQMDGDGAWWGVLGGVALGAGLGIASANLVDGKHTGTVFGATIVGTVLLGALGYELTSHHSAKLFRENRYALAPTLVPGSRGTMGAGLAFSGAW